MRENGAEVYPKPLLPENLIVRSYDDVKDRCILGPSIEVNTKSILEEWWCF